MKTAVSQVAIMPDGAMNKLSQPIRNRAITHRKLKALNSSMVAGYAVQKAVRGELYSVTSTEYLLGNFFRLCIRLPS